MNGIHDMGGMQDMGPIKYEKNEPVFHATWEGRVYAMSAAVTATKKLRLGLRPPMENLSAAEYLRMSYYELWLTSLTERLIASDLVTRAELESGRATPGSTKAALAVSAAKSTYRIGQSPDDSFWPDDHNPSRAISRLFQRSQCRLRAWIQGRASDDTSAN